MRTIEQALATLEGYVRRSTHWQEGGATRHDALLALKAAKIEAEKLREVELYVTAALGYADEIAMRKESEVSYDTMQRSGFRRKEGWRRKYSLTDARSAASCAAIQLRNAWGLLDPIDQKV